MALISYCKIIRVLISMIALTQQSGPLWTWRLEIWQYVIASSMKIYCTDQCLVHYQYLDWLYKSLSNQHDVWQYCSTNHEDGMCYSMAQRLVLHLLYKWLFSHEHILWCLTCTYRSVKSQSGIWGEILHLDRLIIAHKVMCVSFITLRVDYERGQFYERSSCKIIVGVVLTNYVSNLYTILLIESVVQSCWKKVSCAFGFDVMMM